MMDLSRGRHVQSIQTLTGLLLSPPKLSSPFGMSNETRALACCIETKQAGLEMSPKRYYYYMLVFICLFRQCCANEGPADTAKSLRAAFAVLTSPSLVWRVWH